LIKRTTKPIDKETVDLIISTSLNELVPDKKVKVNHSYYTHGNYDWVIYLKTDNIKNVKLYCNILEKTYKGYIKSIDIIQIMFPIKVDGILNPEIEKLHEFV
jgi:hypothetical protein